MSFISIDSIFIFLQKGYQFASQRAQEIINSVAIQITDKNSNDFLRYVAKTSISSKVNNSWQM
jgi:chaperonin GroEL (HSP60 family)